MWGTAGAEQPGGRWVDIRDTQAGSCTLPKKPEPPESWETTSCTRREHWVLWENSATVKSTPVPSGGVFHGNPGPQMRPWNTASPWTDLEVARDWSSYKDTNVKICMSELLSYPKSDNQAHLPVTDKGAHCPLALRKQSTFQPSLPLCLTRKVEPPRSSPFLNVVLSGNLYVCSRKIISNPNQSSTKDFKYPPLKGGHYPICLQLQTF